MRKIIALRETQGYKNTEKFKYRIVPIFVTALLLVFSIICATAADLASDDSENVEDAGGIVEPIAGACQRPERATVTVIYDGYEYATCNSLIMPVETLLCRIGIVIDDNTTVDCPLGIDIYDGMTVTVGIYTTGYYTEEVEVPFETIYLSSKTIPKGETRLVEEGVNGVNVITHEVTSLSGAVISDEIVSEGAVSEPVDAVYYKGTGGSVTAEDGTVYNYSYYIDVVATAYHTGGITATGHEANEEVVAVDPKVIPYGTKMFITGNWGEIGYRSAEDCGNFKGNRIDVCMEGTRADLLQFGRRNMRVYILE